MPVPLVGVMQWCEVPRARPGEPSVHCLSVRMNGMSNRYPPHPINVCRVSLPSWRAVAVLLLVFGLFARATGAAAEAPYRTLVAAREGSNQLVETLQREGASAVLALATRDSHLDDPRVQENLARMRERLPARMDALGEIQGVEFVGLDRFMSSFGRYTYRVQGTTGEMRVMFTWRRKTHGWRLNQFFID